MKLARFSCLKKLHLQSEVSLMNNSSIDIKRSNIIYITAKRHLSAQHANTESGQMVKYYWALTGRYCKLTLDSQSCSHLQMSIPLLRQRLPSKGKRYSVCSGLVSELSSFLAQVTIRQKSLVKYLQSFKLKSSRFSRDSQYSKMSLCLTQRAYRAGRKGEENGPQLEEPQLVYHTTFCVNHWNVLFQVKYKASHVYEAVTDCMTPRYCEDIYLQSLLSTCYLCRKVENLSR